jgi:hypothetical protein
MIKLGIKKIEYRADNTDVWHELKTVSLSVILSEDLSDSPAGKYSTVKVDAEIRNSSEDNDAMLRRLSAFFYQYRITDMNGHQYMLGNAEYRANFTFSRSLGDLKTNGYKISIEYKSPDGIKADN